MSTPLLEDVTLLDAQAVLCPDPQCASPASIEDRCTCGSTDGSVEVLKVRCFGRLLVHGLGRRPLTRNRSLETTIRKA